MKNRRVLIAKVGASTMVTMYPEGHPLKSETYRFDGNYRVWHANGVIFVEPLETVNIKLEFKLSDLDETFGATTPDELITEFSERLIFAEGIFGGGGSGSDQEIYTEEFTFDKGADSGEQTFEVPEGVTIRTVFLNYARALFRNQDWTQTGNVVTITYPLSGNEEYPDSLYFTN